jgi:hypothetical protein
VDTNLKRKKKLSPPDSLLTLTTAGVVDCSGIGTFALKGTTRTYVFTAAKKPHVVNTSPYIPMRATDELSCYAMLLLHTPWPNHGEAGILGEETTAVSRLHSLTHDSASMLLPAYFRPTIEKITHTDTMLAASGRPFNTESNSATQSASNEEDDNDENFNSMFHGPCDMPPPASMESDHNTVLGEPPPPTIRTSTSKGMHTFYKNFVTHQLRKCQATLESHNRITDGPQAAQFITRGFVPVDNAAAREQQLEHDITTLDADQRSAYNRFVDSFVAAELGPRTSDNQLVAFLSGEAGTGKSHHGKDPTIVRQTERYFWLDRCYGAYRQCST